MTLLTAYIIVGTLVALTVYLGMIIGAGAIRTKEYFEILVLAVLCGALWPVTALVCIWAETHS